MSKKWEFIHHLRHMCSELLQQGEIIIDDKMTRNTGSLGSLGFVPNPNQGSWVVGELDFLILHAR